MAVNFSQAAQRHFNDATLLKGSAYLPGSAHLPNAMQLFGLSAECALKAILIGTKTVIPDPVTGDIPKKNKARDHIAKVWPVFSSMVSGRSASQYLALLQLASKPSKTNPFDGFTVDHRYEDEATLPWPDFPDYENGATVALHTMNEAKLNGDVP